MAVHVFGIRHHGPGCARALRNALCTLEPDIVLVEGPPDAHAVLPALVRPEMKPPVALLVYAPENPQSAAYFPLVHYSPEWQALTYAFTRSIPARFMDLPQAYQLEQRSIEEPQTVPDEEADVLPSADASGEEESAETQPTMEEDPIGQLAFSAGYADRELWWEHQIEQRRDAVDLFEAILEAMTELRAHAPAPENREAQREAWMRRTVREVQAEGFEKIAVICGAWHAPALLGGTASKDAKLLTGLKKIKVEATWVPWTNSRLSYRTGYGAGIAAPGWYEHLWDAPDRLATRWVARGARLLRSEDLDAASANVIEAVRLAEALAAMRTIPMPGLAELHEAMQTVLCGGDPVPMTLIRDKLETGERMGEVPEDTPAVPLARDLTALQRSLRLKPSVEITPLDLDLRRDIDLARSRLLHRLNRLGIPWGQPERAASNVSTFHELWRLQWHPEFVIALIEASVWGNSVEAAATARAVNDADRAPDLPTLTALLDATILGGLPAATDHVLARVRDQAAVSADVLHLMHALPPLARVSRYGDVRGTGATQVDPVITALFQRVLVGLPLACRNVDDEAASKLADGIAAVQESVSLLDRPEQRESWSTTLGVIARADGLHGLLRGWGCRLLLEAGALDSGELRRLAGLVLAHATPPPQAAAWVEGVLRGSGLLLLHQDGLWRALDAWMRELPPDTFTEMLPLLRRAFSGFQPPERRKMGDKVRRLGMDHTPEETSTPDGEDLDRERADLVLPILAQILGVQLHDR